MTFARSEGNNSGVWVERFVRSELKGRWGDGVLLKTGNTAPNIEMVNLTNGAPERLSKYFGKIIILDFWTTWCHPCQFEMAELQRYSGRYPDWKGRVALITVSVDENQDLPAPHLRAKGWDQTHNVWIDAPAIKAFHIDAIPTSYVIDGKGRIVAVNPKSLSEKGIRAIFRWERDLHGWGIL